MYKQQKLYTVTVCLVRPFLLILRQAEYKEFIVQASSAGSAVASVKMYLELARRVAHEHGAAVEILGVWETNN